MQKPPSSAPAAPINESEDSDSDTDSATSSSILSSSSASTSAAPNTTGSAPASSVNRDAIPKPPQRLRSPSPPYFGFSSSSYLPSGRDFLGGYVPGLEESPAARESTAEFESFREFYLEKVVECFGTELSDLQKACPSLTMLLTDLTHAVHSSRRLRRLRIASID